MDSRFAPPADITQGARHIHFLAVASIMMRRIVVNHAVARRAAKRGWTLARAWLHRELAG